MHNGDCMIFVSEETESLIVRLVYLTDNESTESYVGEMLFIFRQYSCETNGYIIIGVEDVALLL